MAQRFRALTGINYAPGNKRAEAGDIVDDLTLAQVSAFMAIDPPAIEAVPDEPTPPSAPSPPPTPPAPLAPPDAPATEAT